MGNYIYKRLDKSEITQEQFKQICDIESTGGGYDQDCMREQWLEDEKDDNFVCMDGDRVVGYLTMNPMSKRRNGSIYIVNLKVMNEYRKQGIAIELINTACKYYVDKNQTLPISLQVDKDNIPAINLYQKIGFQMCEPICELDIDDEQYIMESNLQSIKTAIENIAKQLEK